MQNKPTITTVSGVRWAALVASLLLVFTALPSLAINTKTATASGNWSTPSIWTPAGVPTDTDNIVINSGVTVTVDGDYICRDLDMGHNSTAATTLKIITAGNSLTVTGDLDLNVYNRSTTYLIDAGPGDMVFSGTFSHWSTSGTNRFQVGTGSISFTPSVSITSSTQSIAFTGGGAVTFNSNFSDAQNKVTFYTGCTINFHGNYTVSGVNVDWGNTGTANFYGTGTITPTKNINLNVVNIIAGASTTLATSATGSLTINNNLVVNSTATFTMNAGFQLNGSLTNNGTLSAGAVTLTMKGSGTTQIIGGSSPISLPTLQIGNGIGADINVVISQNTTVSALTFSAGDNNRTITINSGKTLTVTGNATLAQPTKDNMTALISVGAGTLNVNGNLVFSGTNSGTKRIAKVAVTSGTFTLTGGITWMSNSAVATEVITVSTGTVNFNSSITLGDKSGTINLTSSGNLNFNGTSAPSLTFGGATAPALTAAYGGTISFAKGLTTNTTALTLATGSNVSFSGTGTLTPNATLTFANVSIGATYTLTAAGNFYVKGNWTNNGTFAPGTYTVNFNGTGTKTISRTGGETFYKLTTSQYGGTVKLLSDVTVTNTLTMSGSNININGYNLTLGNSAGAVLTRTAGIAYGGTFKRWFPAGAITSTSGNYYGLFPIGTASQYRPLNINSTSNPTTAGYVMATHTDGSGGTVLTYTDNEGSNIQQITNQHSDITTSGLAGGTYTLEVKFTQLGTAGSLSNLKLETHTAGVMGSCGTHSATLGAVSSPVGKRTGLSVTNLANAWVMGTNDRNSSPLYTYVYSRKSGNWNDNSATGTWSYTSGGSGAACNCLPTAGGYAVIEAGHTVTVTTTDTIQFLDISSSGSLVINTGKTFNVTANMDMFGTATFTNSGTLNVTGELLFSPSTSQTFSGNVNVAGWFTLDSGATYNHSSGSLVITGDLEIDGSMSLSSGATMAFSGVNATLSGTGSFTTNAGGVLAITNDKTIAEGTSLTIGTAAINTNISIAANTTVNNLGSVSLNGSVTGTDATSTWINNSNALLNVSGALLATGTLDAVTAPNAINYNGSGAQNIKIPAESYHTLVVSNAGIKSLTGDVVVDSAVSIAGAVVLEEGSYILAGDANLLMSGSTELKMTRTTDVDVYPELRGTYTMTGGTVTITQNGDSAVINEGPYYNLKLNGTYGYDLGAVSNIANNMDIQNTAFLNNNSVLTVGNMLTYSSSASTTLNDSIATGGITLSAGTLNTGGYSINVNGSGGWSKASGATFTPSTGTVYFTGTSAQTLGGTSASQTFNSLCVNKAAGTVTVGGSTTTLNIGGDMILNAGVLDKGTAANINMTGGNWVNNGGSFTPGTGTVTFNSTSIDQAVQGAASSETFNNVTMSKSGYTLAIGGSITTVSVGGNLTLSAGTFSAGTGTTINMTGGNWTNNGASVTPGTSLVSFTGSSAQAINGTATSQTFNKLTVNKTSNSTLSVSGSTTSLTLNADITLAAGTFDKGTAANIYVAGNWVNNGGSFTFGTGTVHFNSSTAQIINGTATSQVFYKINLNKPLEDLTISGSTSIVMVMDSLILNGGRIVTGANRISISATGKVVGANSAKYIYGNEELYVPNTLTPSRTFDIGDGSSYAPVTVDFTGTTSGSGSIVTCTSGSDDADIATAGIDASHSVNRTWTLTNNGVAGFSSYAATFTFAEGDRDAGSTPSNFEARRYYGGTWYATTAGTRTASSTQITNETGFGKIQIGEKATLTVATHPVDTGTCSGAGVLFTSTSSSTPSPTVKWQRDPNTGTFSDITGGMDGGVYTGYTSTTLTVTNVSGLSSYKFRAVFTNLNGSVTSNSATLTTTSGPTITGSTPGQRCDAGTVNLGATASAGTISWYAAASGGSSLGTGTSFITPSISTTTSYYADATNGGCTTPSRTAITATVTPTPNIVSTSPASHCSSGTVDLGATASAGTINWYANSSGGTSLGTGTSFTTPSISSTTTYYVDATSGSCTTASRTAVTANINAKPVASVGYQSCAGVNGSTTIRVVPSGGVGPFTYSTDGVTFSSSDTVHILNGANHNYYVKDNNNCTSDATNYSATSQAPTQIVPAALGSTSCSCPSSSEGRDVYLTDNLGNLIAVINDRGHDLGTITATVYPKASPVLIANNQGGNTAAMGRNYVLDFIGTNLSPAVEVTFPFTNTELTDLISAAAATPDGNDDINTLTDLGSTQYEGPGEDSTYDASAATMLVYHRQLSNGNILNGKYIKVALTANGEHWLHGGGSGSPLPVKLVSFEAVAKPLQRQVLTNWVTAIEINNHYFTVERSIDGVNFTAVGRVEGNGNSTSTHSYSFTDTDPVMGTSYYRLKQTDYDGQFTYSNTISVTMASQSAFRMYPNPTEGDVTIAVTNPGSSIYIAIHDVTGRTLFEHNYDGLAGNDEQQIGLNLKELMATGIYMVNVTTDGVVFKQKLLVN